MTQKLQTAEDSDEGYEDNSSLPVLGSFNENPWINKVNTESQVDDFTSQYCKYWVNDNAENKKNKQKNSPKFIGKYSENTPIITVSESYNGQYKESEIITDEQQNGVENGNKYTFLFVF